MRDLFWGRPCQSTLECALSIVALTTLHLITAHGMDPSRAPGFRGLPLRLQFTLLFQQHCVPLQPLPADLLTRSPEELSASTALFLNKYISVLPQTE